MRFIILVLLAALLTGCHARKIELLRVETPLGAPVPGAAIEIGTIYSGHPYPPPGFSLDASGSVTFPQGEWVNGGSYIVVSIGDWSAYFTREEFRFESRRTLVLRLSQAQMRSLQDRADLPATPSAPDFGIPSQDLRFQLP